MPRTAPAVNGTPQFRRVSLHWIDYTGDQRSDSLIAPAAVTVAQVDAWATAAADESHASLWKVEIADVYEGSSLKTNATEGNHSSVFDNIVALFRNPTTSQTQNLFIPAPLDELFEEGTDVPDVDPAGALATTLSAGEAVIGAAAYNAISARFTERREINTRQKF